MAKTMGNHKFPSGAKLNIMHAVPAISMKINKLIRRPSLRTTNMLNKTDAPSTLPAITCEKRFNTGKC